MERLAAGRPRRVVGLVEDERERCRDWVEVAKATSPVATRRPWMPARVAAAKIQVAVTLSGSVEGLPTERDDSVT